MVVGSCLRTLVVLASAAVFAACAKAPAEPTAPRVELPKTETVANTGHIELQTVYFDFDRAEVRGDAKRTLKANASAIRGNGSWRKVVVEGHCDERGSEEYNMALGERRADAVKRYLMDVGLPGSKITTVSYGESRPKVRGHDEHALQSNRRVAFTLVN